MLRLAAALGLLLSLMVVTPSPGARSFPVDTTAPSTTIESGPSVSTDDSSPTFEFSSTEEGSSFECRVDAAPFTPCASPSTTAVLGAGPHSIEVRAIDPAGNVDQSPAGRGFAVVQNAGPHILATGDSMMRNVDRVLGQDLARIREVSFTNDARIGSGVSRDDWVGISRRQAHEHLPVATAVFLGAADGFAFRPRAPCCREAWVAEYTKRVEKMIRAYSRRGLGEVYWLTLPAPRDARRGRIFAAVNRAIRRAVWSSGPQAHLVDTWAVLTPGGRYRRAMIWKGVRYAVRTVDGVHLRGEGAVIAAELIRDAMLEDGIVG